MLSEEFVIFILVNSSHAPYAHLKKERVWEIGGSLAAGPEFCVHLWHPLSVSETLRDLPKAAQ